MLDKLEKWDISPSFCSSPPWLSGCRTSVIPQDIWRWAAMFDSGLQPTFQVKHQNNRNPDFFKKSHATKVEKKVFCSCCIPFKWQPVYRCPCQESNIPKENLTISFSFKITLMLLQSTSALLQGNFTTLLFFHLPNFSFLHLTQKIKQLCLRFNWHNHLVLLLWPKTNFCFRFSEGGKEKNWINLSFVSPSVKTPGTGGTV